VLKFALNHYDT